MIETTLLIKNGNTKQDVSVLVDRPHNEADKEKAIDSFALKPDETRPVDLHNAIAITVQDLY